MRHCKVGDHCWYICKHLRSMLSRLGTAYCVRTCCSTLQPAKDEVQCCHISHSSYCQSGGPGMRHCKVGDHCWYICRNLRRRWLRWGTKDKGKSALTYNNKATASDW